MGSEKPRATEMCHSAARGRPKRKLLGRFLLVQGGAHGEGSVGIDGAIALVDETDDALLIDDDVGAQSPLVGFVLYVVALENAVGFEHLVVHIAEQGKSDADLLGEGGIGRGAIHANAEYFRIRGVDLA